MLKRLIAVTVFATVATMAHAQGGAINCAYVGTNSNGNVNPSCATTPIGGTLPDATDTNDRLTVNSSGAASIVNALTEGVYNVAVHGGLSMTSCSTDQSSALATIVSNLAGSTYMPIIMLPPGCLNINAGLKFTCSTSGACSGYSIIGAARDQTKITSTCTNGYGIWYDNTFSSGDNFKGMILSDFTFTDTSGSGACGDGIRFTQTAANIVQRISIQNLAGKDYSTGTITISGATVTGSGTSWTAAMAHGVLSAATGPNSANVPNNLTTVKPEYAEICSVNSGTSMTLCSSSWPSGNIGSATAYNISYGGRALTIDGGNSYSQYISIRDVQIGQSNFGIFAMGVNTSATGTSRFSVEGKAGWINFSGSRGSNNVAIWLGRHSDTPYLTVPINNYAVGVGIDSGHAGMIVGMEVENQGSFTPVSVCNGGAAVQDCTYGYYNNTDIGSAGYSHSYVGAYAENVGYSFFVTNTAATENMSIIAGRNATFSYNVADYYFGGASTNSVGCPANGSGLTTLTVLDFDCAHVPVAVTVG